MNEYGVMFDSLQEGIVVVEKGIKIAFMNIISNKIISKITGMADFFENLMSDDESDDDVQRKDPMDKKIFYIFDNQKIENKGSKKKYEQALVSYSIRDVSNMTINEL